MISIKDDTQTIMDNSSSTLSSSVNSNNISSNKQRAVSFDVIEIREYEQTIGDNPSVSSGPAISLSWCYYPECKVLPLDEYESQREPFRRDKRQMLIPPTVREHILQNEWGVSNAEMLKSVNKIIKAKNQRRRTMANMHFQYMEESIEAVKRGLSSMNCKSHN